MIAVPSSEQRTEGAAHAPPLHTMPSAQSAAEAQVVRHAGVVASHA